MGTSKYYSEKSKNSTLKYLDKLHLVRFRVSEEEYSEIVKFAEENGFQSPTAFMKTAIFNAMGIDYVPRRAYNRKKS